LTVDYAFVKKCEEKRENLAVKHSGEFKHRERSWQKKNSKGFVGLPAFVATYTSHYCAAAVPTYCALRRRVFVNAE